MFVDERHRRIIMKKQKKKKKRKKKITRYVYDKSFVECGGVRRNYYTGWRLKRVPANGEAVPGPEIKSLREAFSSYTTAAAAAA